VRVEDRLKAEANRLGFSLCGIAPATEADGFARFTAWLSRDFHGEMGYLTKHADARRHPESILADVRNVVMVGLEYGASVSVDNEKSHGRVAAYAHGPDYHRYIWDRLNILADWLEIERPGTVSRAIADTAPLLERDFARRAGLGWFGKNTMLINKHRGSFFFLGALLTTADLKPDPPHVRSHCGTCTACLDACPTQAFPEPGILDARRCISYLTIELRTPIPEEHRANIGDWLFGCDICQQVCPWNRDAGASHTFPHDPALQFLDPIELLGISQVEFRKRFGHTSLARTKRAGLRRNAAIVLGNVGDARAIPALEIAAKDEDAIVREAATWARERIRTRSQDSP